MGPPVRMRALLSFLASWIGLGLMAAWAFANQPVGSVIANAELPTLDGGTHALLSSNQINVFLFFKPGLEFSNAFLKEIAVCHTEMIGKPVHWVAVVSDRMPTAAVQAEVKQTGIQMPVLIDEGDRLFGRLGVKLYPSVGITDADRKLVAYEPFRKVHYTAVIRARIRHLLKEINDADLEKVLHPPPATLGGDTAAARRRLKLGTKLLEAQRYEKAMENAQRCLELDPNSADAHVLLGRILAAQNKPAQARRAFEQALQLAPENSAAREGLKGLPEP